MTRPCPNPDCRAELPFSDPDEQAPPIPVSAWPLPAYLTDEGRVAHECPRCATDLDFVPLRDDVWRERDGDARIVVAATAVRRGAVRSWRVTFRRVTFRDDAPPMSVDELVTGYVLDVRR